MQNAMRAIARSIPMPIKRSDGVRSVEKTKKRKNNIGARAKIAIIALNVFN